MGWSLFRSKAFLTQSIQTCHIHTYTPHIQTPITHISSNAHTHTHSSHMHTHHTHTSHSGISVAGYIVSVLSMVGFVTTLLYQKHFWALYIPVAFIGWESTYHTSAVYSLGEMMHVSRGCHCWHQTWMLKCSVASVIGSAIRYGY